MKNLLPQAVNPLKPLNAKLACAFLFTSLLSACGGSGGSGAGDAAESANIQAAIAVLQPFVGVYELQDGWMGSLGDRAFLSIRLTANDGISEAVLIDFDDTENCLPERFIAGEVEKDAFSDRVFLNDIQQFSEAELTLEADTLFIEFTDLFDTDNDDDVTEVVTIQATRLGQSELDLGPTCQ